MPALSAHHFLPQARGLPAARFRLSDFHAVARVRSALTSIAGSRSYRYRPASGHDRIAHQQSRVAAVDWSGVLADRSPSYFVRASDRSRLPDARRDSLLSRPPAPFRDPGVRDAGWPSAATSRPGADWSRPTLRALPFMQACAWCNDATAGLVPRAG